MRKQSKTSLTRALTRATRNVLANRLASLSYGAHTTPGPRQTAILAQIATGKTTSRGIHTMRLDSIVAEQGIGRRGTEVALAALRARGLVRKFGNHFHLTDKGEAAAANLATASVPEGVGLVLTGHALR
jgi:hypothetical protein